MVCVGVFVIVGVAVWLSSLLTCGESLGVLVVMTTSDWQALSMAALKTSKA